MILRSREDIGGGEGRKRWGDINIALIGKILKKINE